MNRGTLAITDRDRPLAATRPSKGLASSLEGRSRFDDSVYVELRSRTCPLSGSAWDEAINERLADPGSLTRAYPGALPRPRRALRDGRGAALVDPWHAHDPDSLRTRSDKMMPRIVSI